jgi:ATP-binding cassette subfamily B protein
MLFVDGVDVNEIPVDALRSAIGAVPQDPFLFSGSIRDNIAFGSLADPGEEAIRAAAERSRLSADLGRFVDGLDQVIGERGVTLSGGQRQRLAIARALVRAPRILLLDDSLSSVDSQTEREIQERLREFRLGRTAIVVTHRLADVSDADLALVLDEGRLVERGRHDDLVAAGGVYARLWDRQKLAEELART